MQGICFLLEGVERAAARSAVQVGAKGRIWKSEKLVIKDIGSLDARGVTHQLH